MFTGLVQAVGTVESLKEGRLLLGGWASARHPAQGIHSDWGDPIVLGESISVNGCCLTVVASDPYLEFDLSEETLARTSLGALKPGSKVNLERAMRIGDRLGGHIVQGHVDGLATIQRFDSRPDSWVFTILCATGGQYLIEKGSVTLDGVSLTVVSPRDTPAGTEFEAHIIPHTWTATNLSARAADDQLNIEFDALAKHVERLMAYRSV